MNPAIRESLWVTCVWRQIGSCMDKRESSRDETEEGRRREGGRIWPSVTG